jgi:hypothetical protein
MARTSLCDYTVLHCTALMTSPSSLPPARLRASHKTHHQKAHTCMVPNAPRKVGTYMHVGMS